MKLRCAERGRRLNKHSGNESDQVSVDSALASVARSSESKRDGFATVATIIGLAPGLVFPFVAAVSLTVRQSDLLFFVLSLSVVMMNVVVASIEANTIATIGNLLGSCMFPSAGKLWGYTWRSLSKALPAVMITVPALFIVFSLRDPRWASSLVLVLIIGFVPVFGSVSAIFSGALIAAHRPLVPIASQGFRTLLPLVSLLVFPRMELVALALLYCSGELARTILLYFVFAKARSGLRDLGESHQVLSPHGLVTQMTATVVSQGNPIVDRWVLAGGAAGSMTSYELADKIYFALYQLVYSSLVVRRVGEWSVVRSRSPHELHRVFFRGLARIVVVTSIGVVLVGAFLAAALMSNLVPESWVEGAIWALIILPSVPLSIIMIASTRLLVVLNAQRALLKVSILGFGVNTFADVILFISMGPVGVPIASIVTRLALSSAFLLAIAKLNREEVRLIQSTS